jgi:hypothetical protein
MTEITKFWMVYGVGQRGSTYQHRSKAQATAEAERLASLNPGSTFVVLAAVGAFSAARPVVETVKIRKPEKDDGIPF